MSGPHQGQPVRAAGVSLERARALVLLVHGRGDTAENILTLAGELGLEDVAYRAPQAAGFTWYPQSFLAPIEHNQPGLSSGLAALAAVLEDAERAGIPSQRQVLLGFSQGACLTTEFAARNPRRYGGVVGFTGGLVGPAGTERDYPGSLDGTPVFLGSSDPDPHVPWIRVEETAEVLEKMGAAVALRRYPGMGHTINREEIEAARSLLDAVAESAEPSGG
ncbi:MAG: dienelactone hydrolase family protein [Thermoanaerobaculia bacterium]